MVAYTIEPVSTGSFAEAETSLLYYLADDRNVGVEIPAVYWMFVVRGEGALAIVDTGPRASPRVVHWVARSPPIVAFTRP